LHFDKNTCDFCAQIDLPFPLCGINSKTLVIKHINTTMQSLHLYCAFLMLSTIAVFPSIIRPTTIILSRLIP